MENRNLSLTADGVKLTGEYFIVSNGFTTKSEGLVEFKYSDILSVKIVKRRSKKLMYAVMIIGTFFVTLLSSIHKRISKSAVKALKNSVLGEEPGDAQGVLENVQQSAQSIQDNGWIDTFIGSALRYFLLILIGIVVLVCVVSIIYLFSGRRCVELTTMKGTYRVAAKSGDSELNSVVDKLIQRQKS